MRLVSSLLALTSLVCVGRAASLSSTSSRGLPALNAASQGRTPEHDAAGKHGAIATEVDVCSNVGADLLQAGGSAADALIGASLCVGSIDAFHSGIGGGGFILVRYKEGDGHKVDVIDMRERAPAASNETMYSSSANPNASTVG